MADADGGDGGAVIETTPSSCAHEEESQAALNFVSSQEHLLRPSTHNPQPTTMPPPGVGLAGAIGERHVICFLGLPARGKQFMAERLCRYLRFFHGAQCEIFDLAAPHLSTDTAVGDSLTVYLEEEDATATTQLMRSLEGIDDDSVDRLKKNVDSGKIAIIDSSDAFATQSRAWSGASKETRWEMSKHLASLRVRVKLLFIEVLVSDASVVRRFMRQRLRPETPHPSQQDRAAAERELNASVARTEARIREFGRSFVTIQDDGSEDDLAYVKLIDYGEKVITNKIRGFLLMQIVKYLSHVHPHPRVVMLSRHGQSQYNVVAKIGGNPGLTDAGEAYAKWLGTWVPANVWPIFVPTGKNAAGGNFESGTNGAEVFEDMIRTASNSQASGAVDLAVDETTGRPYFGRLYPVVNPSTGETVPTLIRPSRLWTSTLKRTIDTARHIAHPVLETRGGGTWHQMSPRVYRNLDEIFAGDYEGFTYAEIEATFNEESVLRKRDKLGYRYPRGESYLDLIARLDPLMHELESYSEPLMIVSHQATLRIVYAYLTGQPRSEAPKIEIPLHTVIKIEWDGWRVLSETRYAFDAPEGDTRDLQSDGQQFL